MTTQMKAFLTAHGRQLDPALPDGNCLFRALSKQMTGDPSKHAELREILISFISKNPQAFGRGWTIENCTLEEHLAKVAKLGHSMAVTQRSRLLLHCVKHQSTWPLTHSMWKNVCGQYFLHSTKLNLTSYWTQRRSLFPSQNYGTRLPTRLGVIMMEFYLSARTAH